MSHFSPVSRIFICPFTSAAKTDSFSEQLFVLRPRIHHSMITRLVCGAAYHEIE
jgi:hypothetical protein